ncbi:MAG: hypothetical protein D6714_14990 [Bacteroidetes bacterium]|nr:MAG: hypothetical protein D6714_14990 [Bacteroidota bacterium]
MVFGHPAFLIFGAYLSGFCFFGKKNCPASRFRGRFAGYRASVFRPFVSFKKNISANKLLFTNTHKTHIIISLQNNKK